LLLIGLIIFKMLLRNRTPHFLRRTKACFAFMVHCYMREKFWKLNLKKENISTLFIMLVGTKS